MLNLINYALTTAEVDGLEPKSFQEATKGQW